eukprot:292435_1
MADCVIYEADYKTEQEIESIKNLWREYANTIKGSVCVQNFEKELKEFPDENQPPNGVTFILLNQNKIVGAITMQPIKGNNKVIIEKYCELKRLYIQPKHRGNGFAKRMVKKCINRAIKLQYNKIRLNTLSSMSTAQNIYKKMGFIQVTPMETIDDDKKSNKDVVFFELNIARKNNKTSSEPTPTLFGTLLLITAGVLVFAIIIHTIVSKIF